jgi:hypothetical protein
VSSQTQLVNFDLAELVASNASVCPPGERRVLGAGDSPRLMDCASALTSLLYRRGLPHPKLTSDERSGSLRARVRQLAGTQPEIVRMATPELVPDGWSRPRLEGRRHSARMAMAAVIRLRALAVAPMAPE